MAEVEDNSVPDAINQLTGRASGICLISRETSPQLKILWGVILLFSIFGFLAHLSILVQRFKEHPINVNFEYTTKSITFPDVTVCNNVAFSLGRIIHNWEDFDAESGFTSENFDFPNFESLADAPNQTLFDIHRRVENMLYVTLSEKFGHGDYIIAQCLYKQDMCNRTAMQEIKLPGYGNCFTLRSPGEADFSGENSGYRMVLFSEGKLPNDTWLSTYNDRFGLMNKFEYNVPKPTGMRVIIHDKDTYPDPGSGVILSSGSYWNLAMEPTLTSRDRTSSTGCTDQTKVKIKYAEYSKGVNADYAYTQNDCRYIEIQNYWNETCGCISEDYPIPVHLGQECGTKYSPRLSEFCFFPSVMKNGFKNWSDFLLNNNSVFEKNMLCAYKNLLGRDLNAVARNCKAPCEERGFKVSLSQGKFGRDMPATHAYLHAKLFCPPPDWFQGRPKHESMIPTFRDLCRAYHQGDTPLSELQLLRENFLQLNVYFQSGVVRHTLESPAYPFSNLISDIGGILGLYVGVSVLTVCEVIQLIIRIICLVQQAKYKKRLTSVRPEESDNELKPSRPRNTEKHAKHLHHSHCCLK